MQRPIQRPFTVRVHVTLASLTFAKKILFVAFLGMQLKG